ncbi:GxxExxY protein [Lacibacter cauensis]|uniref:GxxExxY protein n=1 Tax=Lacibacter cauensis TaxID=510947 RepID=A0A562SKF4_9BACT|nr:GxxExxY protein [Lacibacter cauensis]TWI81741.1 GxxExxY protein [Lacibacter cauensis]
MNTDRLNELSKIIVDACYQVHVTIGPGLLESVYEFALLKEFELRQIKALNQVPVKLFYKGFDTGKSYAIDILVEDEIVLEIKSSEIMHPVYEAQIISYLKLANKRLGFLVNFNSPLIKDGIKRFVNNI